MQKIIIDTNAVINAVKYKIYLDEEIERIIQKPFEILVPEAVVKELKKIAKTKRKNSIYAKVGLQMIKKFKIVKSKYKNADKEILRIADKDCVIITNDKRLEILLKKRQIKTIFIRELKKMEIN